MVTAGRPGPPNPSTNVRSPGVSFAGITRIHSDGGGDSFVARSNELRICLWRVVLLSPENPSGKYFNWWMNRTGESGDLLI
jgi:hypothetical protein